MCQAAVRRLLCEPPLAAVAAVCCRPSRSPPTRTRPSRSGSSSLRRRRHDRPARARAAAGPERKPRPVARDRQQAGRRRHDRHRDRGRRPARRLHARLRQQRPERADPADAPGRLRPDQGPAPGGAGRADADVLHGAGGQPGEDAEASSSPTPSSRTASSTSARSARARSRTSPPSTSSSWPD